MVTLKPRGQIIFQTEGVSLRAGFRDQTGNLTTLDAFPAVSIISPAANVYMSATSAGVYLTEDADGNPVYGFDFVTGINTNIGVWTDLWQGAISGSTYSFEGNFVVANTQLPQTNADGYIALGDPVGFNYSQTALANINILLELLRARLKSAGKRVTKDSFGNEQYSDCDIFSVSQMVEFLIWSLSEFNSTPYFTNFTFDDSEIIRQFSAVLVDGATLIALSSQALIERGREYSITDNGISVVIPSISELLNTQWNTMLSNHRERVVFIKNSMRPDPLGTGIFSLSGSQSSVVDALRWRKFNRVI